MKVCIINACSDLGVHVNGAEKGPTILSKQINANIKNIITVEKNYNYIKSLDKNDLKKNFDEVNKYNSKLYNKIIGINDFCITLGGDHSVTMASSLGSLYKNKDLGIIWLDSHSDYHTLSTTVTGNLHGLPFATVNGLNKELTTFHENEYYSPNKSVLIGARDIDRGEYENIIKAGVKIFTTSDIKKYGVKYVLEEAIKIASNNNKNGIHVSYDLDLIDPEICPGVSIKAKNGISEEEAMQIADILKNNEDIIKSFDLVEYNPDTDIDDKTLHIATNILNKFIS